MNELTLNKINLLLFSFKGNISEEVLQICDFPHSYYIPSDLTLIDNFVKVIVTQNPKYIIGLGMYSGRDIDKLRMETLCNNRFGNTITHTIFNEYSINKFFKESSYIKESKGIGNSYSNYISYQIMNRVQQKKLDSQYTFIHIPYSFDKEIAAAEILSNINRYV